MDAKKGITLLCIFVFVLQLVGCGPASLTDDEFAAAAQEDCQALTDTVSQLSPVDFASKAAAYHLTIASLSENKVTEKSAPKAVALLAAMTALEDAQLAFATAVDNDLTTKNIARPATLLITEDGHVIATPAGGSIFNLVPLDVDPALFLAVMDRLAELKEAASAIGLETCAAE